MAVDVDNGSGRPLIDDEIEGRKIQRWSRLSAESASRDLVG